MTDFDVAGRRVFVIPHQVFPTSDVPDRPGGEPPMVLFFGTLRANKGLDVLGEAMRRHPSLDIRLTIAGRGDRRLEASAQAMAEVDGRVTAEIGQVTLQRKRQLFCQASIVVLPYVAFSSQSGVLHDAYGHGRPVLVTDVGALGETVREDETGVVVAAQDPDALAMAIRARSNPQLGKHTLGRRGTLLSIARLSVLVHCFARSTTACSSEGSSPARPRMERRLADLATDP